MKVFLFADSLSIVRMKLIIACNYFCSICDTHHDR